LLDASATVTPPVASLDAASLGLIDVGTLTPVSFDAGTASDIQDSATASDAKLEGG
jgi:hypothetical protein